MSEDFVAITRQDPNTGHVGVEKPMRIPQVFERFFYPNPAKTHSSKRTDQLGNTVHHLMAYYKFDDAEQIPKEFHSYRDMAGMFESSRGKDLDIWARDGRYVQVGEFMQMQIGDPQVSILPYDLAKKKYKDLPF